MHTQNIEQQSFDRSNMSLNLPSKMMEEKPFSIREDLNASNIKVDDSYQQTSGPFNIRNLDSMT